jgi:hypothetical protein
MESIFSAFSRPHENRVEPATLYKTGSCRGLRMKSLPPPAGTLDHRQDGQAALVAATPPALPAFCKLSADLFTAALTSPRLFDRRQRRERSFQDGFSLRFSIVIDDPKLGPALDERQFAGGNCEIEFPGYALDAIGFQNILEVSYH